MMSNGFMFNEGGRCLYCKMSNESGVMVCLYVDDLLIFGTDIEIINETKSFLSSHFDMKDLGEADVILGIKIVRSENGISLTQSHYIEKILRKYNHFDCKPVCTPFDPSIKLERNTGEGIS